MADKRINFKLNLRDEAARQSIDGLSKYMEDTLEKAATRAIQSAFSKTSFTFSGGVTGYSPSGNGGGGGGFASGRGGGTVSTGGIGTYRERQNSMGAGDFTPSTFFGNNSFNTEMRNVTRVMSSLNSAMRQRQSIIDKGSRIGHISYNDSIRIANTSDSINKQNGGFASAKRDYSGRLGEIRNNNLNLENRISSANAMGENTQQLRLELKQGRELANAYQKYIEAINQATDAIKTQDVAVNGTGETSKGLFGLTKTDNGISVDPERGTLAYNLRERGFAIGARTATQLMNVGSDMYSQGKTVNRSTGQQALEMGTLSGGLNDQQVREQVQGFRGQYGYDTQQGLDFYTQAMRQRGRTLTADEAKRRVGSIEAGGRASGLAEQTYSGLLSSAAGGGAINSNSDVKNIVQTVLAANAMSGNAGNKEQNAQTLTTLISSIASSRNVSTRDVSNAGVMQSALSSAGRSWQGDAGANNIASMNSSFQAAGQGQNNSLLYLIMRSRGQGGVVGYQNAQVQAEKGMADPANIKALRQFVNSRSGSASGRALAATYINNTGMTNGPEAAKELVNDIVGGKLSDAQIAQRQQEAAKKGKNAYNTGADAFDSSQYKTLEVSNAQKERNSSKTASDLNWMTRAGNFMTQTVPGQMLMTAGGVVGGNAITSLSGALVKRGFTNMAGHTGIVGSIGRLFTEGTAKEGATSALAGAKNLFSGASGLGTAGGISGALRTASDFLKPNMKAIGGLGLGLNAVGGAIDIATSKDKWKATGRAVGSTAGGYGLGLAGGALAGSAFGPIGTIIGGGIGMLAGSKLGEWAGDKAHGLWDSITGKDKNSSQNKLKSTQAQLNEKDQKQMLNQWDNIMDKWTKNIKNETANNNGTAKSSSKTHHAFGGIVSQRTEIAEGDRPEYVVPLDPAKQSYTKNALNQIAQMTGIRATDGRRSSVQAAGSFSPNITINHTGSGSNDDDALVHRLNQAMTNAVNDYRYNLTKQQF